MDNFKQQFNNKAADIRLKDDEKSVLRQRLLTYMDYHPLLEDQYLQSLHAKRKSFFTTTNALMLGRVAGALSLFFIMIVPVLAEKSLPGDALYPVKISFNEEIRGAFKSSPYKKIEWETERLERRVAEAKLLADSGRLTASKEEEMAKAIKQHSNAAKDSIASIRESDEDEAAIAEISLASALDISAEVLVGNNSTTTRASSTTSMLAEAVSQARASVNLNSNETSYDKLMARIESETTRAYEYLNGLGDSISPEDKASIDNRLSNLKTRVNDAAELKATDSKQSTAILVEVLGSVKKVISFMTNLDVRNNVKIDNLVPVASTKDEREVLKEAFTDSELTIGRVKAGVTKLATTSTNYIDISNGIDDYNGIHASTTKLLDDGDLSTLKESVNQMVNIANGLLNNLQVLGIGFDIDSQESSD